VKQSGTKLVKKQVKEDKSGGTDKSRQEWNGSDGDKSRQEMEQDGTKQTKGGTRTDRL
jgi:hypothetical protein